MIDLDQITDAVSSINRCNWNFGEDDIVDGMTLFGGLEKNLIRRAREIIQDQACWTQSTAARHDLLRAVNPRADEARSFCVFGALTKAVGELGLSDRWLTDLLNPSLLSQLISANDSLDHASLISLLKRLEREP